VTSDDAGAGVHKERSVEAELRDRCRDLRHLRVAVCPRILRLRQEPVGWPDFDAPRHHRMNA
jgi:hypothetical protein